MVFSLGENDSVNENAYTEMINSAIEEGVFNDILLPLCRVKLNFTPSTNHEVKTSNYIQGMSEEELMVLQSFSENRESFKSSYIVGFQDQANGIIARDGFVTEDEEGVKLVCVDSFKVELEKEIQKRFEDSGLGKEYRVILIPYVIVKLKDKNSLEELEVSMSLTTSSM